LTQHQRDMRNCEYIFLATIYNSVACNNMLIYIIATANKI